MAMTLMMPEASLEKNEFASMGRSGFQSWQQSLLLEHASEDVKRRLADAQLKRDIRRLEKENSEHEATHVLMQLNGAAGSSTSSLSSPDS